VLTTILKFLYGISAVYTLFVFFVYIKQLLLSNETRVL